MLIGFFALAMVIMKLFPETPLAQRLMLYLVALPIEAARKLERKHLILLAILLFAGQSFALIGSAELALAYAVDMSLYYDALITVSTAAAATRLKAAGLAVRMRWRRLCGGRPLTRARRPRQSKQAAPRKQAANDDGECRRLQAA